MVTLKNVANVGCTAPLATQSVASSGNYAGWLPIRLFVRGDTVWVDWCYIGEHRLMRPFFNEDATVLLSRPFNQVFRRYTPIDEMVAWSARLRQDGHDTRLQAIIGHVSRCGSTLVCQMLAELPTHRVLSEPPMLDVLLNIRRRLPQVSTTQQLLWLQALVLVLGYSQVGESHLILKLDAWHVLDHSLIRAAFPDTPFVFIIREPGEVAASHLKLPAVYMIPGAFSQMPWHPPPGSRAWSDESLYVAAILGEIYRCGAEACADVGAVVVDHAHLPDVIWTDLRETFAIPMDESLPVAMRDRARGDAKRPQKHFDASADRMRTELLSSAICDALEQSCGDHYRRLRERAVRYRHASDNGSTTPGD